jgi:hypothetical protein
MRGSLASRVLRVRYVDLARVEFERLSANNGYFIPHIFYYLDTLWFGLMLRILAVLFNSNLPRISCSTDDFQQ